MLFSLLLVLAPAVVFEVIAISNGRRTLVEAVGRQLTEEARGAADSLSGTLNAEFGDLRTFARQDLMREIRIGDIDKRVSTFLASLQHGEQSILELHVTNLDGAVIAASNPARIGEQDSPSLDFASSAPLQELLYGPEASPVGHGPALRISVPIPDPDRNATPIGRLTALYDWEQETKGARQIRRNLLDMGLDVDVLITDKAGVVIGGAMQDGSPTRIGADLHAAGWTITDEARYPALSGFVVDQGAGTLVGYARLREGAPAWSVLVAQPLSRAFEPVRAMTIRLGIALAMVLATALGLAMLLANRVARPLRDLTNATKEIASGEGTVPAVPTRSRDEVGQLAAAFNQMSIDLRRAQNEVLEVAKFAFVGELAAGVAHQVRTTLSVLRSSAQILQPSLGARDAEAAELIQIMLEEIDHLNEVVSQLLDLGRPREFAIESTHLAEVVFRAADFVEAQARRKGIAIKRVGTAEEAVALCDERQIYQLALHLLVNAVQVLSPGGEITVAVLPKRTQLVGFEVRDNGPGIPDEIRQKIFLPFFTCRDGGIGLGLTFAQRVVQGHKGKLSVESELSRGSVFRVELPAAETQE